MARRGYISIGMVVLIILGLLTVYFAGIPMLNWIRQTTGALFVCDPPAECVASCGEGYSHQYKGDAYCKEKFEGTRGGGVQCCVPDELPEGQVILPGNIQLYYNGQLSNPIRNGGRVALGYDDGVISGRFDLNVVGEENLRCVVRTDLTGKRNTLKTEEMFALGNLLRDQTSEPQNTEQLDGFACKRVRNGILQIDLTEEEQAALIGQKVAYQLLVIDKLTCEYPDDFDPLFDCNAQVFSFTVEIPGRNPRIALALDGTRLSPRSLRELEPGVQYNIELTIDEPYSTCSATPTTELPQGTRWWDTAVFTDLKGIESVNQLSQEFTALEETFEEDGCLSYERYEKSHRFRVPENIARGVAFKLEITTAMTGGRTLNATEWFLFRTATDDDFRVVGMTPTLTRQKLLDLECTDAACTGYRSAFVTNPLACSPETAEAEFAAIANLTGTPPRWTLDTEANNGKYLCVRANTTAGPRTTLATYNQNPVPTYIDATEPALSVDYRSFAQIVTVGCEDRAANGDAFSQYVSGCKQKPYTIAWVTNPLDFVASIVTGGVLADTWRGCPDPYREGPWAPWPVQTNELPYLSREIQVLCVRAQDNAGNAVVKSRLLFSSQALVDEVLEAAARERAEREATQ